jgi:hypothetical protein
VPGLHRGSGQPRERPALDNRASWRTGHDASVAFSAPVAQEALNSVLILAMPPWRRLSFRYGIA